MLVILQRAKKGPNYNKAARLAVRQWFGQKRDLKRTTTVQGRRDTAHSSVTAK